MTLLLRFLRKYLLLCGLRYHSYSRMDLQFLYSVADVINRSAVDAQCSRSLLRILQLWTADRVCSGSLLAAVLI